MCLCVREKDGGEGGGNRHSGARGAFISAAEKRGRFGKREWGGLEETDSDELSLDGQDLRVVGRNLKGRVQGCPRQRCPVGCRVCSGVQKFHREERIFATGV
jgi:hypothetical protein